VIRRKSLLLVVLLLGPAAMSKAQTDKISEYSSSQGWHLWESPSVITIICQYTRTSNCFGRIVAGRNSLRANIRFIGRSTIRGEVGSRAHDCPPMDIISLTQWP
jgi:hypothetical protein